MKRKILSLILIILLCPVIMFSTACGKDDSYKLSSLEGDFKSLTVGLKNIQIKNDKFVFDYSSHKNGEVEFINELIRTQKPYTNLQTFNTLLDNLLCFTYEYVDECSSDSINVNAEFRNNLKVELDGLQEALKEVDLYTNQWSETALRINSAESACLARFEMLLNGYNNLYQRAISFSNSISYLYYNHALSDANPKISNANECMNVLTKLKGRIKYQTSNLTQSFVEMNIDGGTVIKNIVNKSKGYAELDLNSGNYLTNVNNINVKFDVTAAGEKATASAEEFCELAVNLYNLQNVLANDFSSFVSACNKVQYLTCKDAISLSPEQEVCLNVIEDNHQLLTIYNNTLTSILQIIK